MKKVSGVKLQGKYGGTYQGPDVIMKAGTGQSGGVGIPRYNKKNFLMRLAPSSPGMIKASRGARVIDGIIRYPTTADVDPVRAARDQALMDYNGTVNSKGGPSMRATMERIYGEAYREEFERLARLRVGQSGPSGWTR